MHKVYKAQGIWILEFRVQGFRVQGWFTVGHVLGIAYSPNTALSH